MKAIEVGDQVPEMSFESTDRGLKSFIDLKGKNIVLYFYPRDNTPGCSKESKDFNAVYNAFLSLNTQVIGVSRDSLPCHQKFHSRLDLSFQLISDPKGELCEYFGVVIKKNFIKKLILGIERTTFLIDEGGVIRKIWRQVKIKEHAQEVLAAVQEMTGKGK